MLWIALALPVPSVEAATVLFDASRREMAGNADWVIDADAWDLNLPAYPCTGTTNESNPGRFPTPAQSGVTASTSETYWTGAISAWAIELVKAGHTVETLPNGTPVTYGDGANSQDLSHYQLFIVVEPQNPFTAAERSAILAFVDAGGGLFMVADHETSDRDCDGWDSPHVFDDLMGASSPTSAGLFGIWFRVDGLSTHPSEDWFDDPTDANVETAAGDPILHGPFGAGTGGLGLFGATSMEINPADNPSARAHVWRTGQAHDTHRVTFATATYGSGRVAAIGDSSPADDGTGDPGDSLHPGWDRATGGVSNREIHLNACAWLLNPVPDTTPPIITAGPAATAGGCSATVTWSTDEPSTSLVEYGTTMSYGATATAAGLTRSHGVLVSGLAPETEIHYRVSSVDAAGNGPTTSSDATFTTAAAAPPVIVSGPQATALTGSAATVTWTTDVVSTSVVEYGSTTAYGGSASAAGLATTHSVPISCLAAATTYHYRVLSTDACGSGPTTSTDATFTTGAASLDLSGWTLKQYNSSQSFTFPPGSAIPTGGYLVVARDATRAEFETVFPSLPAAAIFVDSNASGSCANGCFPQVNGGETFELYDAAAAKRDGPTITVASGNAYERRAPADPAGSSASWNVVPEASANPGQGAGSASGAGVVLNEVADASDYRNEFVEIFYDAGAAQPDTVPPASVTDLAAAPVSSASIRLTWTATGNDGTSGTAASYSVRMSLSGMQTDADFTSATPVPGLSAPRTAGTAEQFVVHGLTAGTRYYFAMKVADGAGNVSGLSNGASAVTAASVDHLLISQIRVSGTTDDVVELYNPTDAGISVAGTSVQYLAANGNFGFRVSLDPAGSVPARGWYLIAANGYAGSPARDDGLGTLNMSGSAGHALLVGKTAQVTGCSDAAIVDRVGYGSSAACPEGGAGHGAQTPTAGQSVTRKPGGCAGSGQDTDANDADFQAPAAPVFHGASSAPATPPPTVLNNGPICEGATLQLTASTLPGASYSWTGPNGFTSSQQNPTIQSATAAASGTYSVTVGGCSASTTTATVIANEGACDDGNPCAMNDACHAGTCAGTPVPRPAEVDDGVRLARNGAAATIRWNLAAGATSSDLLRGLVSDLSAGPVGGNESCLADDTADTTATDGDAPSTGAAFWYLVRGDSACAKGPYGFQSDGTERTSPACP